MREPMRIVVISTRGERKIKKKKKLGRKKNNKRRNTCNRW